MNSAFADPTVGKVASLHLHGSASRDPLTSVQSVEVVENKGILDEPRYFGRLSKDSGQPSKRQLSLMEREQIAEHAATLGMQSIPPGAVRANIETLGINLIALLGHQVQIGDAVIFLYQPRTPCGQMDAICQGLRAMMENSRQGVMAQVIKSGRICVGDTISVVASVHREEYSHKLPLP